MERVGTRGGWRDLRTSRATQLRALILTAFAATIVTVAAASAIAWTEPTPDALALAGCSALIFASVLLRLDVRIGSQQVVFTWLEAAVILGLFVLPPGWLVLTAVGASTAAQLVERYPARKMAVNTGSVAIGAAMAAVLYHAFADPRDFTVGSAVGAVFAAAAFTLFSDAAVSTAIALAQDLPVRQVMADGMAIQALTTAGNVLAAVTVQFLLVWDPRLLIVLPLLLAAVHSAYRHRLEARLERRTWQELTAATARLASLHSEDVAARAVVDLATVFRADVVELRLDEEGGADRRIVGDAGGIRPDGRLTIVASATVEEPLSDAEGAVGTVFLHFGGPVTLTGRETASLRTYCAALATALRNAALHRRQRHEATHDSLTGLPNRSLLLSWGAQLLAGELPEVAVEATHCPDHVDGRCSEQQVTAALLLLDLDHFKEVNDTLGHQAGDLLLTELASRLALWVDDDDLVARLGGDEFAIVVRGLHCPHQALTCAAAMAASLTRPVTIEGLPLSVEGSIGVACAPQDAETIDELLRRADVAMYHAKRTGSGIERYAPDRDGRTVQRLALTGEVRAALRDGGLRLDYQPKVDLLTGSLVGAEALVRWDHPVRGPVPPSHFVPAVEATVLIGEFTLHILEQAITEATRWYRARIGVPIAVNLSARTLLDPALPRNVRRMLDRHGLPPHQLVLEVTETVAMSELDVVERVLHALVELGVELSVDDFGTGYSSLTVLSRTRLHELKIDRSFVAGMLVSSGDAAIVRSAIELARSFDLRVVAEGIESDAERSALLRLGCQYGQGYLFGLPIRAGEFELCLEQEAARRAPRSNSA